MRFNPLTGKITYGPAPGSSRPAPRFEQISGKVDFSRRQSSGPVPSLDLNFALGSFAAARGPLPTFSRASAATYVGSDGLIASATTNTPRIDYDPVNLECRGLLMEPAATNEFSDSNLASGWAPSGVTNSSAGTSPAGFTAVKLTESATTQAHFIYSTEITTGSGSRRVFSIYAKSGERSVIGVAFSNAGDRGIFVDLDTGEKVGDVVTAPDSFDIQNAGNGWWRISICQDGSNNGYPFLLLSSTASASDRISYAGDGTSGLYVYGAQCEASALTSLIVTSGSSATRAADVCSISGSDFSGFYNAAAGTIVIDATILGDLPSGYPQQLAIGATSGSDAFLLFRGVAETNFFSRVVSSSSVVAQVTSTESFDRRIRGISYNAAGVSFAINGAVTTEGAVALPVGVTEMSIGSSLPAGTGAVDSLIIQRIRYYQTRISDAQLLALTTP